MYRWIRRKFHPRSLGGQLLKKIILILAAITMLSTVLTYFIVSSKVRESYDRLLAQTARVYEVTIDSKIKRLKIKDAQINLQTLWKQYDDFGSHDITGHKIHNDEKHSGFQLLNTEGKVLIHSYNAPEKPWSTHLKTGFSDVAGWRLYTLYNPESKGWMILGQALSNRTETVQSLTMGLLLPLIMVLLVLTILLPRIILAGLYPLRQLAREVKHQNERNLKPITLTTDSTELDQIVIALNELISRVNTSIEREQRFVADAAHELRTPLTVINLYSQELGRKNTQESNNSAIIHLQKSIIRARRVVEQMLSLSKAEGEESALQFETIDIMQLLREIIASIGITAIQKSQQLALEDNHHKEIKTYGHRALLYSLFANLIDNAIRYTPEHGNIIVSITSDKQQVTVTVCDSGPGLTPEQKTRVFDRFYRGETGSSDGAGLGLSIVSSIVQKHQGTFTLENRKDQQGLMTTIVFPVIDQPPNHHPPP